MSFPRHFDLNESSTHRPSSYNASLRRPWSPIRYNGGITDNTGTYHYLEQDDIPGSMIRGQQRDRRVQNASEDSVEALDLADYARTLTTEHNNPYPPFPHTSHLHPLSVPSPVHAGIRPSAFMTYPEYPPSPENNRPFSAQSRDTFNQTPPSLVSGGTSHDTHDSYGGHHYSNPTRRPYSLPPFLAPVSTDYLPSRGLGAFSAMSDSPRHNDDHIASPVIDERDEADISRFPAFSQSWYEEPHKTSSPKHSSLPPYSELQYDRAGSFNPFPSTASNQSRNILPWGSQLTDPSCPPLDDAVKKERIRMLEHEFGKKGRPNDTGEPVVGSVDEKGALVTVGPKKRASARWAQGILALATAISSLYGAFFIKSPTPAPPASKAPAFALYILSVVTFFFVFYLFALRPCCCGKRSKATGLNDPNMSGMMVLPVQGLPGGKKKKEKKGKKGKYGGGDVQVNLIVDPDMLRGSRRDEEHESEEDYDLDGSQVSSRRRGGRSQVQQRRSIFQGLAMESDWNAARQSLRRMLFVDIACLIAWAGVFILILFGKKCAPGGFNGWCDSYNIASATACVLCVAFGFSVFFDIVDLHMSKTSPRTRT